MREHGLAPLAAPSCTRAAIHLIGRVVFLRDDAVGPLLGGLLLKFPEVALAKLIAAERQED